VSAGPSAGTQSEEASNERRVRTTAQERERIELRNRSLRRDDVLSRRLIFESRPHEAHIGFSNYCNMSCIMCWDGENPPLVKMSPQVLAKVADQIAPSMSVITPHSASEPLVLTWDDTRRICEQHSIRLSLTTNVQFLDEEKFYELKDITETLHLSIDSHIREIFEKIRPGSRADTVFENLERTARLCREHGVECIGQAVFMAENAAMMPETAAYLADLGIPIVNVIPLIDVNGHSGLSDPLLHFSSEYVEHIKQKCIGVAREKQVCLRWLDRERHDFRDECDRIEPDERTHVAARWEHHMKFYAPGYCRNAYGRLRINADGEVAPCCCATDGDLVLGRLAEHDFPEIWNGPNAQDLRRGMVTWDYSTLCSTCRFVDRPATEPWLPFVEELKRRHGLKSLHPSLPLVSPEHLTRSTGPPKISFVRPAAEMSAWFVALSLGGGLELEDVFTATTRAGEGLEVIAVRPRRAGKELELEIPAHVWNRLESNLGYWWTAFGIKAGDPSVGIRGAEIRCLVRHEGIERVADSTLRYPDSDGLPVVDLGRERQLGWAERGRLPERPQLGERTTHLPSARRLTRAKKAARKAAIERERQTGE
jgi:radical SAM protein with 4Fe4S-binding SPASM domain